MASNSIFESRSSERRWVSDISKIIDEEVRVEIIDIPVSIFRVPTTISSFKPEAYTPQLIGLGPYHRFRPELYEMERYKVATATRAQKKFKSLEFKQLVHKLNEKVVEYSVRACYHKFLGIDGDTLAWIMAIDGLFLLDFLNSYVNKKDSLTSCTTTALLLDASGKTLAQSEILGDIVMLENQIPIFVLSKILSIQTSMPEVCDNQLPSILMGFCKALSPLKLREDLPLSQVSDHSHLLDLLYHLTVPELSGPSGPSNVEKGGALNIDGKQTSDSGNSTKVFVELWNSFSNLTVVSKFTKPIKVVIGPPWNYITSLLGISKGNDTTTTERDEEKKTPKVEEIMIPSVSNLRDVGVKFCPTSGDITSIKFDTKTKKLYLPVITLNINSEVVMRNLVAYEASISTESLVFARYTELMNGIIDTVQDATVLRENKIIVNSLKSDADAAEVFNGMSKSVRLTNVLYIDKAIGDVNNYFYNTKKVRVYTSMKKYVYGSWKVLTVLAVILLILLSSLQSFCSVYTCKNVYVSTST